MPPPVTSATARLTRVPGIGAGLARRLARRGIATRAQLRAVADELPRKAQLHLRYPIVRRIPRPEALAVVAELKRRLVMGDPPRRRAVVPVGSVRREEPASKDLDLLVIVPDAAPRAGVLSSARLARPRPGDRAAIVDSYLAGERRRSFVLRWEKQPRPRYYAVDLFLATRGEKPYALLATTGGKTYNIRIRALAKRQGFVLNQYGLFHAGEPTRRVAAARKIRTERDLALFLGATYRPPNDPGRRNL